MSDSNLISIATTGGTYNTVATALTDTATVLLVDGLTITYTADKAIWADNSNLTYTLTITNSGSEYPYVMTAMSTTQFDDTLVNLVADSVKVDNADFTDYTFTGGVLELTFTTPVTIDTDGSLEITFQLQKV